MTAARVAKEKAAWVAETFKQKQALDQTSAMSQARTEWNSRTEKCFPFSGDDPAVDRVRMDCNQCIRNKTTKYDSSSSICCP